MSKITRTVIRLKFVGRRGRHREQAWAAYETPTPHVYVCKAPIYHYVDSQASYYTEGSTWQVIVQGLPIHNPDRVKFPTKKSALKYVAGLPKVDWSQPARELGSILGLRAWLAALACIVLGTKKHRGLS